MLKKIEINGFKSFAKKTVLSFDTPITAIVGPNGSGKSNVVESIRYVLGEQSMKSMRGKGSTDLIWKGSKLLPAGSKARVAISFDNKARMFAFSNASGASADLSYDEITLSREVSSDGGSDYFINGTPVRLKDITELLGSVNIGASGHHIISQGEADRLLSATSRDRRGMIEDALGLKIYQLRIREAERKIEKTAINMKEVQALRRELAPHLNFLGKQVEKIQMAEELRREFGGLFSEYFYKETESISVSEMKLGEEEIRIQSELNGLATIVTNASKGVFDSERSAVHEEIRFLEEEQSTLSREREEIGRALGRIEGKLDALFAVKEKPSMTVVPIAQVTTICATIVQAIDEATGAEDLPMVRSVLVAMRDRVTTFTQTLTPASSHEVVEAERESIRHTISLERAPLDERMNTIEVLLRDVRNKIGVCREKLSSIDHKSREAERDAYAGVARRATLESHLRECVQKREMLARRTAFLSDEVKEAEALLGEMMMTYEPSADTALHAPDTQERAVELESLHRKLERIKIKLEDAGAASGAEVLKEFDDTRERDAFLSRELIDIETSLISLRELIHELRDTIERSFKEGVEKINTEFNTFFKLMFGGGGAFLSISVEHKKTRDEDGDVIEDDGVAMPFEHGIEINVSLPHKKVKDLAMLSGGERSLISIALLFAMSQVNPPPFLVLDETDAALDEANSRKYGDMLTHLSQHSKLIVVTHNRETMSRAQVLYGITMGIEGASKLLSIKFDEAVLIAK